ncbi:hypothetical protein [Spirillospora sp. NBC_01491]|uniref:hypothetical protein n=1 Tax=Spirillospora sp. NBC_01491 TaxID=2976007 RepID=UPI002E368943|nr:hypothetical protein [Spirillospora sp. NBC_01491]
MTRAIGRYVEKLKYQTNRSDIVRAHGRLCAANDTEMIDMMPSPLLGRHLRYP